MDMTSPPVEEIPQKDDVAVPAQPGATLEQSPVTTSVSYDDAPPKPEETEGSLFSVAKAFPGVTGLRTLFGMGVAIATRPAWLTEDTDRPYQGLGSREFQPKDEHVQRLRENQKDPVVAQAFNLKYGEGTAERYLSYAKKDHIDNLLANKADPEALAAFDSLYGKNMHKYYIPLFDPKSSVADRTNANMNLRRIMSEGSDGLDTISNSRPGEYAGSIVRGAQAAVGELVRSAGSGIGAATGTQNPLNDYANQLTSDTRSNTDPIVNDLFKGLSQAVTGFTIASSVAPGAGLAGTAAAIRTMGIAAFTDAFSFNPNDPMLGDLAKHFNINPLGISDLFSNERYESEAAKRAMRAVEGTGVGLLLQAVISGVRAVKLSKAGKTVEAEAAKEQAAQAMEKVDGPWGQGERPERGTNWALIKAEREGAKAQAAGRPEVQGELFGNNRGTENGSNFPVMKEDQLSFDNVNKWGEKNPEVNPGLRMDMPDQARPLEQPEWLLGQQARAAEAPRQMEMDLLERWQVKDPQMDLPIPQPRRVERAVDGVEPGTQYKLDFVGEKPGTSVPAVKQVDPPRVTPPQATTPQRVSKQTQTEMIKDAVRKDPEGARDIVDSIDPPPARNPRDPIRKLLNEIPDLESARHEEVLAKVGPVVDRLVSIVEKAEDLLKYMSKEFAVDELDKLSAMLNFATKQATDNINTLKQQIDALIKDGRGAEADALITKDLPEALKLKEKLDAVDKPLGTIASRMMNIRQVEWNGISASAVRERVAALRAQGLNDVQIAEAISDAINAGKITDSTILGLNKKLEAAKQASNEVEAARLRAEIQLELGRMTIRTEGGVKSWLTKLLDGLVEFKLNALLSNPKTILIVNGLGNGFTITSRFIGEYLGQAVSRGIKEANIINAAKFYGAKGGFTSNIDMLSDMFQKSTRAFNEGRSYMSAEGRLGETGYGQAIPGTAGKIVTVPSRLMLFTDEFLSIGVARSEIGAEAAIRHLDGIRERTTQINAIIKDKATTAIRRAELEAELKDLKAGKMDVDGVKMTRNEYIDHELKSKFDENGALLDRDISRQTDAVLLKDKFESATLQNLQNVATHPLMRLTVQPFFRTPIRAMQRGFEFVPGFGQLISKEFHADLMGTNGARPQAIARGKAAQGWALTGWAVMKYAEGELTGPGPGDAATRKLWIDGGWRPNMIRIGGSWIDYSNLDPLATVLKMVGGFADSTTMYGLRKGEVGVQEGFTAIFSTVVQGITSSSMLQGVQDMASLIKSLGETGSADNDKAELSLDRFAYKQVASFIPAGLKGINELLDPRVADNVTLFNTLSSNLFMKDEAPRQYDYLGNVRLNTNPYKALFGYLSPLDERKMGRDEYISASLKNLSQLTGAKFDMSSAIPGVPKSDMRLYPSTSGKGFVKDVYMNEYKTLKLDGQTIGEKLFGYLKDQKYAVGNATVNGPLITNLKKIATDYRKAAWARTEALEARNVPMKKAMDEFSQAKRDSFNPAKDMSLPPQLGNPSVFNR